MSPAAGRLLIAAVLSVPAAVSSAEWTAAPAFFLNADHQSNRTLRPGAPDSQALGASVDMVIARRSETSELLFAPHYYARRVNHDVEADFDDLRLPLRWRRDFERSSLSVGAQFADESTLSTELAATGIVLADAARVTRGADMSWGFAHADDRQLDVAAGVSDVRYTGGFDARLVDYRYSSLSVTENFAHSPRLGWSIGGFGSRLASEGGDNQSRESGVSLGLQFQWSENTRVAASFGLSQREFDGSRQDGRTGSIELSHRGETRHWNFSFDHSLVPYGTGVLVERDTAQFSVLQNFAARVQGLVRAGLSRNEDVLTSRGVDARTYRHAEAELRWQFKETWNVGLVTGYADAQDPGNVQPVDGWMTALRTTWSPPRRVLGH